MSPLRLLDGYGHWLINSTSALPLDPKTTRRPSREHPAGFYGPADNPVALNILAADMTLLPLERSNLNATIIPLETRPPLDLRPWLLVLATLLFLLDGIAVLILNGTSLFKGRSALNLSVVILFILVLAFPLGPVLGAELSSKDKEAARATRIGYIITGDASVDEFSRAGLTELSAFYRHARHLNRLLLLASIHPKMNLVFTLCFIGRWLLIIIRRTNKQSRALTPI